jgi:hypothetical protein
MKQMTSEDQAAFGKLREVVMKHAGSRQERFQDLVSKIIEHENAVQFDDERFGAAAYIRGLVTEYLEDTSDVEG